jgi:hypothetical protein
MPTDPAAIERRNDLLRTDDLIAVRAARASLAGAGKVNLSVLQRVPPSHLVPLVEEITQALTAPL